MSTTRFYVVRHAAVADSSKIYGASDIAIKDFSITDTMTLRRVIPSDVIAISSPLSRAISTLEKVLDALDIDCEIENDSRISEQNFGVLELTSPIVRTPSIMRSYWHLAYDEKPEQGESFLDVYKRSSEFLDEKIALNDSRNYLICTHGGVLKAMLGYILSIPLDHCAIFDIGSLSLTVFEYKDNGHENMLWYIKALGIKLT